MKNSISFSVVILILIILLAHQPPVTTQAQRLVIFEGQSTAPTFAVRDTSLLDSAINMSYQIDSLRGLTEGDLTLLEWQQATIKKSLDTTQHGYFTEVR